MIYGSLHELWKEAGKVFDLKSGRPRPRQKSALRGAFMERLALSAACADDPGVISTSRYLIRESARAMGIEPSSIHDLYIAVGKGKIQGGFTTPACNLRTMTFEAARAIFRVAKKMNAGAFIFEIAKSEMGYTFQKPDEYVSIILAAALREGWQSPVFIQGDHFQINAKNYAADPEKEKKSLKNLIQEAIAAGFYNIDIDSSTIVDYSQKTLEAQQRPNARTCAEMTAFIRSIEPKGVTISVGGEIGEVGEKNSTPEEFYAFMREYNAALKSFGKNLKGISKISVQTGTSHGGTVLPDGSIAKVNIDFRVLKDIAEISKREFGQGGSVQHGASTVPISEYRIFAESGAIEVHLATAYQNMVLDSRYLPQALKTTMYRWLDVHCAPDRKPDMTNEQFYYKTRKKTLGPFKREINTMDRKKIRGIAGELEKRFLDTFHGLNVAGTAAYVKRAVKTIQVPWGAVRAKESVHIGMDDPGE